MTINELLMALLKKIKMIIVVTLLGLIIGFVIAKFFIPVKYTAQISMYVKNSDATTSDQINATDITAAKSLVETNIVILQNDYVLDEIGTKLVEDYDIDELEKYITVSEVNGEKTVTASTLRSVISMSAEQQTEVMQITATTKSPKLSAAICNYMKEISPDILMKVTKAGSVEAIGNAKVPTSPSGPNVMLITVVSAFCAFIIASAIALIMNMLDNTIKTGNDIRKKFELPVLGEIPDIEMGQKGAYSKYGN